MPSKPPSPEITAEQAAAVLDAPRWQPGLEGLDWRERLFVLVYIRSDGDALRSYAIAFGSRQAGWERRAYKLLERRDILEAVQIVHRRLAEQANIDLDQVLARLQTIADSNMQRYVEVGADGEAAFDLRALSEADWRCIKTLKIKGKGKTQEISLELHDAAAALQAIGRHLGMGLGTVKVIEDEKRERAKVAAGLAALSDDDLAQLEAIGRKVAVAAGVVIDGDAVEVTSDEATTMSEDGGDDDDDGGEESANR